MGYGLLHHIPLPVVFSVDIVLSIIQRYEVTYLLLPPHDLLVLWMLRLFGFWHNWEKADDTCMTDSWGRKQKVVFKCGIESAYFVEQGPTDLAFYICLSVWPSKRLGNLRWSAQQGFFMYYFWISRAEVWLKMIVLNSGLEAWMTQPPSGGPKCISAIFGGRVSTKDEDLCYYSTGNIR